MLEDGLVGGVDCGGEAGLRLLYWSFGGGRDQVLEKGVRCEMAGYFSGSCSAHTITDDKDTGGWGRSAGVLVVMTDTAGVCAHCGDEMAGGQVSMGPMKRKIHGEARKRKAELG